MTETYESLSWMPPGHDALHLGPDKHGPGLELIRNDKFVIRLAVVQDLFLGGG